MFVKSTAPSLTDSSRPGETGLKLDRSLSNLSQHLREEESMTYPVRCSVYPPCSFHNLSWITKRTPAFHRCSSKRNIGQTKISSIRRTASLNVPEVRPTKDQLETEHYLVYHILYHHDTNLTVTRKDQKRPLRNAWKTPARHSLAGCTPQLLQPMTSLFLVSGKKLV